MASKFLGLNNFVVGKPLILVPCHVRKIATLSHFNRVCKLSFLQASTPLQSHADLGIDPLNCRVCGRHFNQEASRVRHEQDSHQIRSQSRRSSVVRNILGGRGGSDSDSSIGDSSPLLLRYLLHSSRHYLQFLPRQFHCHQYHQLHYLQ